MKPPLKFRAWIGYGTSRKMVYFDILKVPALYDFDIIMRDTGFVDKNGKTIYEGDVVKERRGYGAGYSCKSKPKSLPRYVFPVGIVAFGGWGWYITFGKQGCKMAQDEHKMTTYQSVGQDWYRAIGGLEHSEVIGNLYENPEYTTIYEAENEQDD